jgi:chemotaxis signal transduction protein
MSDVHVRVRVGVERYAIPVAHVLEVGEIGDLSAAPGASHALLGLRNLRGEVLPVFDLALVLGSPRSEAARRMVVAERAGTRAGFAVDEVTDVDAFGAAGQEADSDLLSSALLIDGSLVGVIVVDRRFVRLEAAA